MPPSEKTAVTPSSSLPNHRPLVTGLRTHQLHRLPGLMRNLENGPFTMDMWRRFSAKIRCLTRLCCTGSQIPEHHLLVTIGSAKSTRPRGRLKCRSAWISSRAIRVMQRRNGANGTIKILCIGKRWTEAATLRHGKYGTSLSQIYANGEAKLSDWGWCGAIKVCFWSLTP